MIKTKKDFYILSSCRNLLRVLSPLKNGGQILMAVALFGLSPQVFADSLEDQVLSGNVDAVTPPADPKANDDADLPALADEKKTKKVDSSDIDDINEAVRGPKEIPLSHILVVQRKRYEKESKHEFNPLLIGIEPSDSFRKQVQWGFSYMYHFSDTISLEAVHAAFTVNLNTGLSDTIASFGKAVAGKNIQTARIEPVLTMGSAMHWSPMSAKAAHGDGVYYFEGYLLAGGGFTKLTNDLVPMGMGGFGFRSWLNSYAVLRTELRDYMDISKSVEHRPTFIFGASFLWGASK